MSDEQETGAGNPPAGWYRNPDGSNSRRYWDGARWTEQTVFGDGRALQRSTQPDGQERMLDQLMSGASAGLAKAQHAAAERAASRNDYSLPLVLQTVDKKLTFYEDRVEMKSLFGSERKTLPYLQIREVRMERQSLAKKATIATMTVGLSLGAPQTYSKTLVITTGAGLIKLKFMVEPLGKIQAAYELLNAAVAGGGKTNVTVNVAQAAPQAATPGTASTADELTKLADLRDRGILTDEEFDAKKRQMLGL